MNNDNLEKYLDYFQKAKYLIEIGTYKDIEVEDLAKILLEYDEKYKLTNPGLCDNIYE